MENFQNWFKIIIAVSVLIAACSLGYYFVVYIPNEKDSQENLTNQIKCQQDGNELYQSQLKTEGNGVYGNPEFKFDKNLKTCLYKNIYLGNGGTYTENFITDVYTNKYVVDWAQFRKTISDQYEDMIGSREEWISKSKALFGD